MALYENQNGFRTSLTPEGKQAADKLIRREHFFDVMSGGATAGYELEITTTMRRKFINDLLLREAARTKIEVAFPVNLMHWPGILGDWLNEKQADLNETAPVLIQGLLEIVQDSEGKL